jgi:hypothetical protein
MESTIMAISSVESDVINVLAALWTVVALKRCEPKNWQLAVPLVSTHVDWAKAQGPIVGAPLQSVVEYCQIVITLPVILARKYVGLP